MMRTYVALVIAAVALVGFVLAEVRHLLRERRQMSALRDEGLAREPLPERDESSRAAKQLNAAKHAA